jgi:hypothetical protein
LKANEQYVSLRIHGKLSGGYSWRVELMIAFGMLVIVLLSANNDLKK